MNVIQFALRILFLSMYADNVRGLLVQPTDPQVPLSWRELWQNMRSSTAQINFRSSCPWTLERVQYYRNRKVPVLHPVARHHCLDLMRSTATHAAYDLKGVCEKIIGRLGTNCSGDIIGFTCVYQMENIVNDKRNIESGHHGDRVSNVFNHHNFRSSSVVGHHDGSVGDDTLDMGRADTAEWSKEPDSDSVVGQPDGSFGDDTLDMGRADTAEWTKSSESDRVVGHPDGSFGDDTLDIDRAESTEWTKTSESDSAPLTREQKAPTALPRLMELLTTKRDSHNTVDNIELSGQRELQQNVVPPFLGGGNAQMKPSFLTGNAGHFGSSSSVGHFGSPSSVGHFGSPSSVGDFGSPSSVGMLHPRLGLPPLWRGPGSFDNTRRFKRALRRRRFDS